MSVEGSERYHEPTELLSCDHSWLFLLLETLVPLDEEPIEEVRLRTRRHQSHASRVFFYPPFPKPVDAYKIAGCVEKKMDEKVEDDVDLVSLNIYVEEPSFIEGKTTDL